MGESSALTAPAIREALQASLGHVPVVTERMTRRALTGEVIPRLTWQPEGVTAREGAVMALLYPKADEITLALTSALHTWAAMPARFRRPVDGSRLQTGRRGMPRCARRTKRSASIFRHKLHGPPWIAFTSPRPDST